MRRQIKWLYLNKVKPLYLIGPTTITHLAILTGHNIIPQELTDLTQGLS